MPTNLDVRLAVLKKLDRPVWIITSEHNRRRGGLTASSVLSVSIDPQRPQLQVGIGANHFTRELLDQSGTFVAHLLRRDQSAVALDFAFGSGRDRDKLASYKTKKCRRGGIVLEDCLAWCDCQIIGSYDAGDRILYWADIVQAEEQSQEPPLTEQMLFQAATAEQLRQLNEDGDSDVAVQRPLYEAWRLKQVRSKTTLTSSRAELNMDDSQTVNRLPGTSSP